MSRDSLRMDRRMAVSFSALLFVLLLLFWFLGGRLYFQIAKENEIQMQQTIVAVLARAIERVSFSGKFHASLLIEEIVRTEPRISFIFISTPDLQVWAQSETEQKLFVLPKEFQDPVLRALHSQTVVSDEGNWKEYPVRRIFMPFTTQIESLPRGVFCVGLGVRELGRGMEQTRKTLFFWILLLAFFSLLITYAISRYLGATVHQLAMRHRGILRHTPLVIVVCDFKGKILETSDSWEGVNLEDRNLFLERISHFSKNRNSSLQVFVQTLRHNQGEKSWLMSVFMVDEEKETHKFSVCCIAQDITARIETEARLRQNEEHLSVTLDSIGDGVVTLDPEGKITRLNRAARAMTGLELQDGIGKPYSQTISIFASETTGAFTQVPDRLISRFGKEFLIIQKRAPILYENGVQVGEVIVFRDVTEQKKLEEQLRQSQKLESVGQLAGGVAHDFNNMLGGILGASELLNARIDTPREKKLLELIMTTTAKAADLTSKLLSFSRKGALLFRVVDFNEILDLSVEILKRSIDRKIVIQVEKYAQDVRIMADATQIENALINLGLNARDAMQDGGRLLFQTRNIVLSQEDCRHSTFQLKSGLYLRVLVEDTGCGIKKEIIERIFEPFFTTKQVGKGTGLGLSAVYGTVIEHGGAIFVESKEKVGTRFFVDLPIHVEAEAVEKKEEKAVYESGQGCILLADDESVVRTTASMILENLGYQVILAQNGKEAMEIFSQKSSTIDLVILDMTMPVMNGEECFYEIKKIAKDVRVIMSSGFMETAVIEKLKEQGLGAFVKKPYRISELAQVIKQVSGDLK